MKSKTEQKLDTEFERIGVRPHIYHFTEDVTPFNAITIADDGLLSWNVMRSVLDRAFAFKHERVWMRYLLPATRLLEALCQDDTHGVAICDRRDQFNRQRGRVIAKGRLLKHLKEESE